MLRRDVVGHARKLSVRAGVGATALLRHERPLAARGLHNLRSTIVLVQAGRKTLTSAAGATVTAGPGDVMLLQAR